jgi:hypothetical protein
MKHFFKKIMILILFTTISRLYALIPLGAPAAIPVIAGAPLLGLTGAAPAGGLLGVAAWDAANFIAAATDVFDIGLPIAAVAVPVGAAENLVNSYNNIIGIIHGTPVFVGGIIAIAIFPAGGGAPAALGMPALALSRLLVRGEFY